MATALRWTMDGLYLLCVWAAGIAFVLISAVIPWAVFTRYVLNSAASWPEPTAVLLTILLTFIGAAACYRRSQHINISFFANLLPDLGQRLCALVSELLVGAMATFMMIYGEGLVRTTWHNSIGDFPFLSVGVTYLPIPIGGSFLLLFVVERLVIGPPPLDDPSIEPVH
ncbi:TRAP-type C4-dicarboxylate transport system, small permease component [Enhydrobacter aerosaccus]|uniref:TRAP transporter small permease protein n=1 Tax=Enhydrobacter aerosaccus TaxID=225324 RepID=A0A1T4TLA9_9HYPH|nr:TRAP transporter small permease [Enhydrobacter aerosaccus]SKA41071.1 TRAP-type C4-dicarboxylate transport system, small permease component [Enhydrobacter aerosaccus]